MGKTMKSKLLLKYSYQISILIVFVVFVGITGCSKDNENAKTPDSQSVQTSTNNSDKDSTLIRPADVKVSSLDIDKDGNLYQCEMDYNVISDKPGTCPKCGMKLVKVSVLEAKKNLDAFNGKE
jgi:uncharacterized membrane protein